MAYRLIEHTADLGIRVTAGSLDSLFAESLRAFTDCLTRLERISPRQAVRVNLKAPDLADLLVEFLGEALYLYETRGLVLAGAEVKVEEIRSVWTLTGEVLGELFEIEHHGLKTLIKAVTYHQLKVWRAGGEWRAEIIFDL